MHKDTQSCYLRIIFFFFNDTATTEIYTLSLHDALPICLLSLLLGLPETFLCCGRCAVMAACGALTDVNVGKPCCAVQQGRCNDQEHDEFHCCIVPLVIWRVQPASATQSHRSEEHTSELQ